MDFAWSEEQQDVSKLAAKILGSEVTEASLREVERAGTFFHEQAWRKLAEAGLLGVAVGEAYGGMGGGMLELCALLEQVGRHVAPVPALSCLAFGALPIERFGSEAQKKRFLSDVARGESLVTGAFSDAVPGPCSRSLVRAEPSGLTFALRGQTWCVALLDRATRVVVAAEKAGKPGLFLLDPKASGVKLVPAVATHGEPIWRMKLERVRVSEEDVLVHPEDPRAADALRFTLNAALAATCAVSLGVAARALEITAKYTSERKQFGVPIATFQAVRQRAADAYIDVATLRLTMLQAAYLVHEGRDASLACASAKHHAAECGYRVTFAAQHLHGGMGYDVDYPLHRYYLWAKAMELTLGSSPNHLSRIGKLIAERTARIAE